MKKLIVLIESSAIAAQYTAEAVQRLGYEPLFLCTLEKYQGDSRLRIMSAPLIDCDTSSVSAILSTIESYGLGDQIAAVGTFLDTHLLLAGEVASKLGVPGPDPALSILKDKAAVVRLIPEFSPETIEFKANAVPFEKLRALFERAGCILIKPKRGAGAMGCRALTDASDIKKIPQYLAMCEIPGYLGRSEWVAQEFVRGELVSLEGFFLHGRLHVLGYTSRGKIGATESQAVFPIDDKIAPHLRQNAEAGLSALAQRAGYRSGYCHVEFILTPERAALIDANMGRIGGGGIVEQIALSMDLSPIEVCKHVLQLNLFDGEGADPNLYNRKRLETFAILYGIPRGGVVRRVRIPLMNGCFHTQVVGENSIVTPMGHDDWSWIGILTGYTECTKAAIREIEVTTEEGSFAPYF